MKIRMLFTKDHPVKDKDNKTRVLMRGTECDDVPDETTKEWIKAGEAEPAIAPEPESGKKGK